MHEKYFGASSAPPAEPGVQIMTALPLHGPPHVPAQDTEEEEDSPPKGDDHVAAFPVFEKGKFYTLEVRAADLKEDSYAQPSRMKTKEPDEQRMICGTFVVSCDHSGLMHTSFTVKANSMVTHRGFPPGHKVSEIMLAAHSGATTDVIFRLVQISENKPIHPIEWQFLAPNGFIRNVHDGYGMLECHKECNLMMSFKECAAPDDGSMWCVIV